MIVRTRNDAKEMILPIDIGTVSGKINFEKLAFCRNPRGWAAFYLDWEIELYFYRIKEIRYRENPDTGIGVSMVTPK